MEDWSNEHLNCATFLVSQNALPYSHAFSTGSLQLLLPMIPQGLRPPIRTLRDHHLVSVRKHVSGLHPKGRRVLARSFEGFYSSLRPTSRPSTNMKDISCPRLSTTHLEWLH